MSVKTSAEKEAVSGARAVCARLVDFLSGFVGALASRKERRLRLCETLSLGERRFVAVVRYREQQFLVGGTGQSIALLAHLPPAEHEEGDRARESQLKLAGTQR